jgi:hypothetical protein
MITLVSMVSCRHSHDTHAWPGLSWLHALNHCFITVRRQQAGTTHGSRCCEQALEDVAARPTVLLQGHATTWKAIDFIRCILQDLKFLCRQTTWRSACLAYHAQCSTSMTLPAAARMDSTLLSCPCAACWLFARRCCRNPDLFPAPAVPAHKPGPRSLYIAAWSGC